MIIITSSSAKKYVSKYEKKFNKQDIVLGVGGGTVVDQSKMVAYMLNKNLVLVPTSLTTDAMFTDSTAVRGKYRYSRDYVEYIPSFKPTQVIFDADILMQAKKLNCYGWADIISIYTAEFRWRDDADYNSDIANRAKRLLERVCNPMRNCKNLRVLWDTLQEEVKLCEEAGTAKVEEGLEHKVAYLLEELGENYLHGFLVAVGTYKIAQLQGQSIRELRQLLVAAGIYDEKFVDYLSNPLLKAVVEKVRREYF